MILIPYKKEINYTNAVQTVYKSNHKIYVFRVAMRDMGYIDTITLSTSNGEYTSHIITDMDGDWTIDEDYVVVIEPQQDIDYMYVIMPSLYEFGVEPYEGDSGPCSMCGSSDKGVSPRFAVPSTFNPQEELPSEYMDHTEQQWVCIPCLEEFRDDIEQIWDNYGKEIKTQNVANNL